VWRDTQVYIAAQLTLKGESRLMGIKAEPRELCA
jgi:hypothetical protein